MLTLTRSFTGLDRLYLWLYACHQHQTDSTGEKYSFHVIWNSELIASIMYSIEATEKQGRLEEPVSGNVKHYNANGCSSETWSPWRTSILECGTLQCQWMPVRNMVALKNRYPGTLEHYNVNGCPSGTWSPWRTGIMERQTLQCQWMPVRNMVALKNRYPGTWNITMSMDARQEHGRLEEPVSWNVKHYNVNGCPLGTWSPWRTGILEHGTLQCQWMPVRNMVTL